MAEEEEEEEEEEGRERRFETFGNSFRLSITPTIAGHTHQHPDQTPLPLLTLTHPHAHTTTGRGLMNTSGTKSAVTVSIASAPQCRVLHVRLDECSLSHRQPLLSGTCSGRKARRPTLSTARIRKAPSMSHLQPDVRA